MTVYIYEFAATPRENLSVPPQDAIIEYGDYRKKEHHLRTSATVEETLKYREKQHLEIDFQPEYHVLSAKLFELYPSHSHMQQQMRLLGTREEEEFDDKEENT